MTEYSTYEIEVSRGQSTRTEPARDEDIAALKDEIQRLRMREQEMQSSLIATKQTAEEAERVVQHMREQQMSLEKPLLLVLRMAGDQEVARLINFDRKGDDVEQQAFVKRELHAHHKFSKDTFNEDAQHARTFVQHNEKYEPLHLCDIVAVRIFRVVRASKAPQGVLDKAFLSSRGCIPHPPPIRT